MPEENEKLEETTDEETIENPAEEETAEEETSDSEQETEENKPEVTKEEKVVTQKELDKLYARMKIAEERAKKAEGKLSKEKSSGETTDEEMDYILEVQKSTRGLDENEVDELRLRAKSKGITLSEARKDDNFVLWQKGYREKVAKEKALNPSTTQTEVKKPKTVEQRLAEAKTFEEKEKILDEMNLNPMRIGSDLNKVEDF